MRAYSLVDRGNQLAVQIVALAKYHAGLESGAIIGEGRNAVDPVAGRRRLQGHFGDDAVGSPGVVDVVDLRADVDDFLGEHGLTRADIDAWICHPGGPKVLAALQDALELGPDDLALTWDSLRSVGNLSSASVLFGWEA